MRYQSINQSIEQSTVPPNTEQTSTESINQSSKQAITCTLTSVDALPLYFALSANPVELCRPPWRPHSIATLFRHCPPKRPVCPTPRTLPWRRSYPGWLDSCVVELQAQALMTSLMQRRTVMLWGNGTARSAVRTRRSQAPPTAPGIHAVSLLEFAESEFAGSKHRPNRQKHEMQRWCLYRGSHLHRINGLQRKVHLIGLIKQNIKSSNKKKYFRKYSNFPLKSY